MLASPGGAPFADARRTASSNRAGHRRNAIRQALVWLVRRRCDHVTQNCLQPGFAGWLCVARGGGGPSAHLVARSPFGGGLAGAGHDGLFFMRCADTRLDARSAVAVSQMSDRLLPTRTDGKRTVERGWLWHFAEQARARLWADPFRGRTTRSDWAWQARACWSREHTASARRDSGEGWHWRLAAGCCAARSSLEARKKRCRRPLARRLASGREQSAVVLAQ